MLGWPRACLRKRSVRPGKSQIVYWHTLPIDHRKTLILLSVPSICGGMILCRMRSDTRDFRTLHMRRDDSVICFVCSLSYLYPPYAEG